MKNLTKKYSCILILIILLLWNLFFILNIFDDEESDQFKSINEYIISEKDDEIIQKVNNDFKPLFEKNFWEIKIDKHFILKDSHSYHLFYFSKKIPNLNKVIDNIIPEIEKLWYIEDKPLDPRTYSYNIEFKWKKYYIIFNILSYELDDDENEIKNETSNMWVFMIYINKLNK